MTFAQAELEGMLIRTAPLGPIATNCYVVACARTGQGAIIDCSDEPRRIIAMLEAEPAVTVTRLLQTHAHVDHVAALAALKRHTQAPIYIHADEMTLYGLAVEQGRLFGMRVEAPPEPDVFLKEGDVVELGDLKASVLETPGHTPGGICFWFERQGVLFSGDLLFAGSIGRTDLPGGDFATIQRSLLRVRGLPDDTLVLSGHGPETRIGRERRTNPFLVDLEG